MKRKITFFITLTILIIFFIQINFVNALQIQSTGKLLEEGIYEIELSLNSNKVIDISEGSSSNGANVQIWERSNVLQQRFQFIYMKDGYYIIKCVRSGKVLDVSGAGSEYGTNVQQYYFNSTDAQKWKINKLDNGYYSIVSKCNNLALTIKKSEIMNGTNVEVNKVSNEINQQFIFKSVKEIKGTKTVENGVYKISSLLNEKKVIDIENASML